MHQDQRGHKWHPYEPSPQRQAMESTSHRPPAPTNYPSHPARFTQGLLPHPPLHPGSYYPHPSQFYQPPLYGMPPTSYDGGLGQERKAERPHRYNSATGRTGLSSSPSAHQSHIPYPPMRSRTIARPLVVVNNVRGHRGFELSLVTYNVLAQHLLESNRSLYKHCSSTPELLEWDYRKQNLIRELLESRGNVLCLQEVQEEHFESWYQPQLSQHGFKGVYLKRTGRYLDGCAIFWLDSQLELLEWTKVQYYRIGIKVLDRDNVGLVAKFRVKGASGNSSGSEFCVATTHLLFNPRAGEVKLAQLSCLLAELHKLASTPSGELLPCLLCGDFNSVPGCPLLQFVERSYLDYSNLSAWDIAGYYERESSRWRVIPSPLLPLHVNVGADCKYIDPAIGQQLASSDTSLSSPSTGDAASTAQASTSGSGLLQDSYLTDFPSLQESHRSMTAKGFKSDKSESAPKKPLTLDPPAPVAMDTGPPVSQPSASADSQTGRHILTHPFTFLPAYPHSTRQSSLVTTYHCSAFETVDYIYYTPLATGHRPRRHGLKLLTRRALPNTHTLLDFGPQPHQLLSSDHLMLQASFQLI